MAHGASSQWEQLSKQAEEAIGAGQFEAAERLYLEAATQAEAEFGRDDERLIGTLLALAHTQYCYLGSYARAEPTARQLLALREEVVGPEHPQVAHSWLFVAQALELGAGRYDEAEQAYRRALEVAEHSPDHPQLPEAVHQLGQFYRNRGRYAEAEPLMRRLVALREREYELRPSRLEFALGEHARVLEKLGDNTEAEAAYRRVFAILQQRRAASDNDMSLGITELRIAQLSAARGDQREAEMWYERALAAFDAGTRQFVEASAAVGSHGAFGGEAPIGYPVLREILLGYATLLRRRGADVEAGALEQREANLRTT